MSKNPEEACDGGLVSSFPLPAFQLDKSALNNSYTVDTSSVNLKQSKSQAFTQAKN